MSMIIAKEMGMEQRRQALRARVRQMVKNKRERSMNVYSVAGEKQGSTGLWHVAASSVLEAIQVAQANGIYGVFGIQCIGELLQAQTKCVKE